MFTQNWKKVILYSHVQRSNIVPLSVLVCFCCCCCFLLFFWPFWVLTMNAEEALAYLETLCDFLDWDVSEDQVYDQEDPSDTTENVDSLDKEQVNQRVLLSLGPINCDIWMQNRQLHVVVFYYIGDGAINYRLCMQYYVLNSTIFLPIYWPSPWDTFAKSACKSNLWEPITLPVCCSEHFIFPVC